MDFVAEDQDFGALADAFGDSTYSVCGKTYRCQRGEDGGHPVWMAEGLARDDASSHACRFDVLAAVAERSNCASSLQRLDTLAPEACKAPRPILQHAQTRATAVLAGFASTPPDILDAGWRCTDFDTARYVPARRDRLGADDGLELIHLAPARRAAHRRRGLRREEAAAHDVARRGGFDICRLLERDRGRALDVRTFVTTTPCSDLHEHRIPNRGVRDAERRPTARRRPAPSAACSSLRRVAPRARRRGSPRAARVGGHRSAGLRLKNARIFEGRIAARTEARGRSAARAPASRRTARARVFSGRRAPRRRAAPLRRRHRCDAGGALFALARGQPARDRRADARGVDRRARRRSATCSRRARSPRVAPADARSLARKPRLARPPCGGAGGAAEEHAASARRRARRRGDAQRAAARLSARLAVGAPARPRRRRPPPARGGCSRAAAGTSRTRGGAATRGRRREALSASWRVRASGRRAVCGPPPVPRRRHRVGTREGAAARAHPPSLPRCDDGVRRVVGFR